MNKILAAILILFSFSDSFSQGEANIWYFGSNAGLDFNSGTAVALTNGMLDTSEGCATISDAHGQLLFYTDGITVYNKLHQVMPDGQGLLGDASATQSAIAIPKPGSNDIYYIFTCAALGGPDGFRYSEVDMSLEGGLGNITSKNILLQSPVTEKITAIKKVNDNGYYVITHELGSNNFLTYDVTPAGVNLAPVVSSIGPVASASDLIMTIGYLKLSPDGTRLLAANPKVGLDLYDFDSLTGVISNPVRINSNYFNYGVEFSPNGEIAYATTSGNENSNTTHELMQYDLTAANIEGSGILLYTASLGFGNIGALQLAPDRKIYVALKGKNHMGRINDPDVLGTGSNFQFNSIDLGSGISTIGLPQFIQSYFNPVFAVQNLCLGSVTTFKLGSSLNAGAAILWDFGDSHTSTAINPGHQYQQAGDYTVTVSVTTGGGTVVKSGSIKITNMPFLPVPIDQPVCGNADMIYDLTQLDMLFLNSQPAGSFAVSYFASDADAHDNNNEIGQNYRLQLGTSRIFAKIFNTENISCSLVTSLTITLYEKPVVELKDSYFICDGEPLSITAMPGFDSYSWSNGSNSATTSILSAGSYSLTVTKNHGTIICDTIKNFIVTNSAKALITKIETSDWTSNENSISVFVTGSGDYRYSLDGENYQDDPVFDGLSGGAYTVYVKDSHECGITTGETVLMMYPNFFTPNGDGYNDYWHIKFSFVEPYLDVCIYDRYGKLLTGFDKNSSGWNGTYNGQPMPSDDYWFVIKLADGKQYKGHFSLKR